MGCHFPLQGMKVKSESEVAQSFALYLSTFFHTIPGGRNHIIMVLLYASHPSVVQKACKVKESNSIPIHFTFIISFNPHNNSMKYYYHIIHFAENETEAQRSSTSIPKTHSWCDEARVWRSRFSYHTTSLCIMLSRVPRPLK